MDVEGDGDGAVAGGAGEGNLGRGEELAGRLEVEEGVGVGEAGRGGKQRRGGGGIEQGGFEGVGRAPPGKREASRVKTSWVALAGMRKDWKSA